MCAAGKSLRAGRDQFPFVVCLCVIAVGFGRCTKLTHPRSLQVQREFSANDVYDRFLLIMKEFKAEK